MRRLRPHDGLYGGLGGGLSRARWRHHLAPSAQKAIKSLYSLLRWVARSGSGEGNTLFASVLEERNTQNVN